MYKIYIDTTKRYQKSVTLTKDEEQISNVSGDIDIVSSIQEILEETSLNVQDIDEFVPNTGPGSFTGIKIGVTIANVFNWILGKKSPDQLYEPNYGGLPNITHPKQ
jgi:tRNA threonylcarbamoyladenosine biosynthesis protein TsaB